MAGKTSLILHRDPHWLVVDKPTGMATHAGKPGELGAVEWLALHLGIKAHVVSRLDRATSGALLLALDTAASARAQTIHRSGVAVKIYEFLAAAGEDAPEAGACWVRHDELDGKAAATRFTCLGLVSLPGMPPLVHGRAEITHGRMHQIRRHAAMSALPLLGDEKYGGKPFARLCLHCREIRWPEISHAVTCPLPPAMASMIDDPDRDFRFALCRDRRGLWPTAVSDAFRAVHRNEIPGLPAALDVYGSWFDAVWFDEKTPLAAARNVLQPIMDEAAYTWGLKGGILRAHRLNPHANDLVGERLIIGATPPRVFTVQEHGLRYRINLLRTQHTGLFLDQRDSRQLVALRSAGKRVANLFAYTCSFAVVAASERAEVVFSVDTARPCLNIGKENFKLNELTETRIGKFIQTDARKWLRRQLKKQAENPDDFGDFAIIVCDPPVFASSRDGGKFSLTHEWSWLSAAVGRLLAPDGLALFANNHRSGDHGFYRKALEEHFAVVTDQRPPLDFPVQAGAPHHVRIFACEQPRASIAPGQTHLQPA